MDEEIIEKKLDYLEPEIIETFPGYLQPYFQDGLFDGRKIVADSITTSQLNFTPTDSDNIVATINASTEGLTIDADNISISGSTTFDSGYDPTDKVDELGGSYDSSASGARVRIFPDANTGIQVIDDSSNDVFKTIVGGTDIGDVIIGDETSNKYLKWDKSEASLDLGSASTINGRVASTISGAIDSSGHFIDANLNTSTKKILKDFTFDDTDYAGAFKTGNITWDSADGSVTGGSGILMNAAGLVGANSGSETFTIDATTGSASFSGTLSAPTGTLGTITLASGGNIKLGQTAYNTGTGFWLGDDSGTPKFSIGDGSTKMLTFDGSTFTITGLNIEGSIVANSFLAQKEDAGEDLSTAKAVIIADGDDKVQIGQGTTDDSEVSCYHDGTNLYFIAQPLKFHKDFSAGDTFKVEVFIKSEGYKVNNLAVLLYEDNSGDPVSGGTYYETSSISVDDIGSEYQKLTADFTISAGNSIDKDTAYWLVFRGNTNEDYRLKCNNNIYYNYYTLREFENFSDYRLKEQKYAGSWPSGTWKEISGELYFKILIPTTSGKYYYASQWGVGDEIPKTPIGLSYSSYSENVEATIVTQGTLVETLILDSPVVGDNGYLDYYGGRITADPTDILHSCSLGQIMGATGGLNDFKVNIQSNRATFIEFS